MEKLSFFPSASVSQEMFLNRCVVESEVLLGRLIYQPCAVLKYSTALEEEELSKKIKWEKNQVSENLIKHQPSVEMQAFPLLFNSKEEICISYL